MHVAESVIRVFLLWFTEHILIRKARWSIIKWEPISGPVSSITSHQDIGDTMDCAIVHCSQFRVSMQWCRVGLRSDRGDLGLKLFIQVSNSVFVISICITGTQVQEAQSLPSLWPSNNGSELENRCISNILFIIILKSHSVIITFPFLSNYVQLNLSLLLSWDGLFRQISLSC